MASKYDLEKWTVAALVALGGSAPIPRICQWVWDHHEAELRGSGDLFYTWQYDIRWAAHRLRRAGNLKRVELSQQGIWELTRIQDGQE